MVQEMTRTMKYNPVLLYKAQSELPQGKCSRLSVNDFLLVLQTDVQAQMLKKNWTTANRMY